MNNPLLKEFTTVYDSAPFASIKNEHFLPAIQEAIKMAREEIDAIISNNEAPSFENTIEALDFSGMLLNRVQLVFYSLLGAETSKELQQVAREISPLVTAFGNDVSMNEELYGKVEEVYARKEQLELNAEQQILLDDTYKSFVRNGAKLKGEDKEALRKIDAKLVQLSLSFSENILAETNKYVLHITDKSQLDGLPEGEIEAAAIEAKQKEKEGWVFTLNMPSYLPFITYASNRELREEMAKAFGSRCFKNDELDNQRKVLDIVRLRHERAKLLGYDSHAHFVLEERMASTPETVNAFLSDLLNKTRSTAVREYEALSQFSVSNGGPSELMSWDRAYYAEKLKQEKFDIDDEQLRPYFELNNCLKGAFTVANKLFGLHFEELKEIEVYHEDVRVFKVTDENEQFVALFYADYFPRAGKSNGAWMGVLKKQCKINGVDHRPHIVNVCNFTKPTNTKPSLLTFDELRTLFHEFGHALHGMLSDVTYPSLAGVSVRQDFVELPSQIMENWCFEQEALELFAFHYETGKVIPEDLVQKIKASANFMEGLRTMRQLGLGTLDMQWHTTTDTIEDLGSFEEGALASTQIIPRIEGTSTSTSFSHLFNGGYSAGYYSYKWAEVLDADAFEYFKQHGLFNRSIGEQFKEHILSKGGTEHPMELYKRFRGAEPDSEALLRRSGLMDVVQE